MSLKVIAIRHAKPEPIHPGQNETLRALSRQGVAIQKNMSKLIQSKGFFPTILYCSPLLRAQQTAQIIADCFNLKPQMEVALGYQFNAEKLLQILQTSSPKETLAFVGHDPTLAHFVNICLDKQQFPSGLSKSCAAIFEFPDTVALGKGQFIDYYTPENLN